MESPKKMDEKMPKTLGNSQGYQGLAAPRSSSPINPPASPLPMRLPTARPSAMVSPPGFWGGQVSKTGSIFWVQQKMMTRTF